MATTYDTTQEQAALEKAKTNRKLGTDDWFQKQIMVGDNPQTVYVNKTTGQQMDSWTYQTQLHKENNDILQYEHALNMKAKGLNPDGSPIKPEWESLVDPVTGKLKTEYQLSVSGIDPTQLAGYSQLKLEALRDPSQQSAWARIQTEAQGAQELAARDAATRQALTGQSQALSQLAMRGGYGSGARTRLAGMLGREQLMQGQNVRREGILNRLNISSQDEQNRLRGLEAFQGAEMDMSKYNNMLAAKTAEYNLSNLLREQEGKRAYGLDTYSEQMKKWAAERQAQATENSGGGGGK
jgi:hypothetical protein